MDHSVKVGILGGGWFGNFHLDNLLRMEGVEVSAFATGNQRRLEGLAQKAPWARTYTNQTALLDGEPDLDALIVCVPPDSHQNIEEQASARGVHLYLEKPLGVDWEQVCRNQEVIRQSGILCAVGYQTRYNPCLDQMRDFFQEKQVGTIVAKWMGIMPQTPWWRIKARSGGQLHEQVTHMIDLLRYLFGEIRSVYSAGRRSIISHVENFDLEDHSASVFTFENGILATVTCGCFLDPQKGKPEIRFEVYSDQGSAQYEWDTMARWGDAKQMFTSYFGNQFHYPALEAFLQAVCTGDSSGIRSPYDDSVKTFAATWAANRSMAEGREIFLDEL